MGTVELTGLVMTQTMAEGQALADASHRLFTMPALVLNRSSRVMPARTQHKDRQLFGGGRETKDPSKMLKYKQVYQHNGADSTTFGPSNISL